MAKRKSIKGGFCSEWPIALWIPNLFAYLTIAMLGKAFTVAFTDKNLFSILYFFSFIVAEATGRFARSLHQTSTLGDVLRHIISRISHTGLVLIISHLYRSDYRLLLGLLALDITNSWLQLYCKIYTKKMRFQFLAGSWCSYLSSHFPITHTYVGLSEERLLIEDFISFYFIDISLCISLFDKNLGAFAYGSLVLNEYFGWTQTLYLLLYLIFYEMVEGGSRLNFIFKHMASGSRYHKIFMAVLPGFMLKQLLNVIEIKNALQMCVFIDCQKSCMTRTQSDHPRQNSCSRSRGRSRRRSRSRSRSRSRGTRNSISDARCNSESLKLNKLATGNSSTCVHGHRMYST